MEKLLIRHSEFVNVPTEFFWKRWTDVALWSAWDMTIRSAWLHNGLRTGSTGHLLQANGHKAHFTITGVNAGVGYTFKMPLLFATMHFRRLVQETCDGVMVTHEVRYTGLPFISSRLLRLYQQGHRQSLIKLKYYLEEEHYRNKIAHIGVVTTAKAS
ncbi:MAG: hypothetical protein ACK4IY_06415 [Chitinophagales bacterium]